VRRVIDVLDGRQMVTPSYDGRLTGPLDLASLSRELGINDWQAPRPAGGTDGRRGTALDRNVELIVPAPSWVAAL
jgi:hypothetical protein